jgi:LemA protein
MNSKQILLGVIGAVVLIALLFGGWFLSTYNGLVTTQEGVDAGWAQVESQYQRRADLIPNLVETVKGFAAQEEKILLEVTKYRSQWGEAKTQEEKIEAGKGMDSAISRLLVVSENYPQLRSNENFLALQSQLEGTENRIAVERMRYNEMVRDYNTRLKRMPGSMIAGMYSFEPKLYFEAEKGAELAPKVIFNQEEGVSTPTPQTSTTASVSLHGEKTDVVMGEEILLRLSAVNLITKPKMYVQVIIIPPSGMSVTSSEFSKSAAGQFSANFQLEPGDGKDIEVRIISNQVGDFNVNGRIIYYFGNDKEKAEDQTLNLPIKVRKGAASR